MKISHTKAIVLSGALWFAIGFMLLYKGIRLLMEVPNQTALVLVVISLAIGFVKGRFILSKTVARVTNRIISHPNPIALTQIYAPSYYIIILSMVALGISFKFFPIPPIAKGMIDLAIGSALMNGGQQYFRKAVVSGERLGS